MVDQAAAPATTPRALASWAGRSDSDHSSRPSGAVREVVHPGRMAKQYLGAANNAYPQQQGRSVTRIARANRPAPKRQSQPPG